MANLPSLATTADLETYLGKPIVGTAQEPRAQALLDQASAVVRRLTEQTITAVTDDVEVHDAPGGQLLILRQLPVNGVASIVDAVDGAIDPGDYTVDPKTGAVWRWCWGMWMPWAVWWTGWSSGPVWQRQRITVTYSHGYEDVPADLVGVCCGMTDRALFSAGTGGVVSEFIGGYRYQLGSMGGVGGVGLSAAEQTVVDTYRVPQQVVA